MEEEKAKIQSQECLLNMSLNNESLSYSITGSSRPTTTIGATSIDARSTKKDPSLPSSTMKSEDQFVNSISRSQLPQFFNDKKGGENLEENVAGAGQARHFYYGADEQSMSVASKDFDDVYNVSG